MLFKLKSCNNLNRKAFCKFACEIGKLPRIVNINKNIWKSTSSIRTSFLNYFENFDHKFIEPCSVRDINNGSYFINSGVCQFKNHILGESSQFKNLSKAVNSQRCIRLGGKKCDLENIGYDSTHLSYFEMLGNWSFRMYDKKVACKLMWEYLTEYLQLPPSHLYITYFGGCEELGLPADEETRDIWFNLGVKDTKILQFGIKDNFWEMGDRIDNSICGPSTEIHWDYLATLNSVDPRCARCFVNSDSPEVVELWNSVFIQYKWSENGSKLISLPGLVVDTGMGLERLASIIQGVTDVFSTDTFSLIIDHIASVSNTSKYEGTFQLNSNKPMSPTINFEKYEDNSTQATVLRQDVAYRIISDHFRTLCVSMFDGVNPGRRGIVLKIRQLLQRAIRQSKYGLGMSGGISPVIDTVCETLQGQININREMRNSIKNVVKIEERMFLPKLENYEKTFENFIKFRQSDNSIINENEIRMLINGEFGHKISLNMIKAMCKDAGLQVSEIKNKFSEEQTRKLKKSEVASVQEFLNNSKLPITKSKYIYDYVYDEINKLYKIEDLETEVNMVLPESMFPENLIPHTNSDNDSTLLGLITSATNMYPEKGGQASDKGVILCDNIVTAIVIHVIETDSGHIIHWCKLVDPLLSISTSSKVKLRVDSQHRSGTTLHHTAHHIIFAGIRHLLGKVIQSSSSVKSDRAKFEFSIDHSTKNSSTLFDPEFTSNLENFCNNIIKKRIPVKIQEDINFSLTLKNESIYCAFPNQMPEKVRLVSIDDWIEVCCGTHAFNTAHLGEIKILSLKKINQANPEISFVTGQSAIETSEIEKELLKLSDKSNVESYWINGQIEQIINYLNDVMSKKRISKVVRTKVNKFIDDQSTLKNRVPGISLILKHEFIKFQNSQRNACIVATNITSIKQILKVVADTNFNFPIMIYDDTKILFHIPKNKAFEIMKNLLENINQSTNDYISEIPQIKNFDQGVLNEYVLITFNKKIENIDQYKTCFEDLMKKLL